MEHKKTKSDRKMEDKKMADRKTKSDRKMEDRKMADRKTKSDRKMEDRKMADRKTKSDRKMEDRKMADRKMWNGKRENVERKETGTWSALFFCLPFSCLVGFPVQSVSCPVGRLTTEQWKNMSDSSSKLLAALFAERRVLSVTEVTEQVKDTLESEFFALHVQGEVSNYKRHQSGHWYFTLKDSHSQLRAVFYRQWNRLMRFE